MSATTPTGVPGVELVHRRRNAAIPYVAQLERTDCGAACLAMLLRLHGCDVPLRELREQLGSGRDGASAHRIAEVARVRGFAARGVHVEVEELGLLPRGSILHWGFRHFVVFDRVEREGLAIVDPAAGRRVVPWPRVRRELTGVAVVAEPAAALQRSSPRASPLWAYLGQLLVEFRTVASSVSLSIVLRLFALAAPMLTAVVVDQVVPRADLDLLEMVLIGLALVFVFRWLALVARSHTLLQLRTTLDVRLTTSFMQRLVELPYRFFQNHTTGDLLSRIGSNAAIRDAVSATSLSALLDGGFAAVYLLLIVVSDPTLGAIALGLGIAQALSFLLVRRRFSELNRETIEARTASQAYTIQALAGMETLKCAGAEQRAMERWMGLFHEELEVDVRVGRLTGRHAATLEVLGSASPIVLIAYGAYAVVQGELGLGAMLALQSLALGFLTPLSSLIHAVLSIQQLDVHLERIADVQSAAPEQDPERRYRTIVPTGRLTLDDVVFRYGEEGRAAIDGVSLDIAPGSAVAIVGESGSGKSTLAKLILGLHEPRSGTISYDGCDLRELDRTALRRSIGVVPQSPFLFEATIRENLALSDPDAPLAAIVTAAKMAAVHDDVMAMPLGYETPVSEGGGSVSGGQKLRLVLARALLHQPSIVLLDEATSQVDQAVERRIMQNLAMLQCTRIIIAHRLSTIAFADTIVVMHEGRIVEVGTHAELMARASYYFRLVTAGAGGPGIEGGYRHGS